jgi:hypothetical protein
MNGKIVPTALDRKTNDHHALNIYPNPASEVISVEYQKGVIASLKMLNVDGVEVCNLNVSGKSECIISVANFPAGIYVLQSFDVDGQLIGTRKLIIQ